MKFLMSKVLTFLAFAILLSEARLTRADIKFEPPPKEENLQAMSVPVDISYVNPKGNPKAKLIIPLATLKALAETAKLNKSVSLPLGVTEPSDPSIGYPHGSTIIAGLALSLAIVSIVYLQRRKPAQKWAVTGTAAVILALGVTTYLWADVRIPGQPYKGPARRPEVPNPQSMVTIEIAEHGDAIRIVVPPVGQ